MVLEPVIISMNPKLPSSRFAKLNVLALLGRALHDLRRGRDREAIMYLGIALVAFKYKKFSLLLQGLASGRRLLSR